MSKFLSKNKLIEKQLKQLNKKEEKLINIKIEYKIPE